jgi:hypothetical protein
MASLSLCHAAAVTNLHSAGGGGDSGLVPALVGAIAGCVLTLAGEHFIRRSVERKRFHQLRALLAEELRQIMKLSRERDAVLGNGDDVPLAGPLPSSAWQLMQASGGTDRLSATSLQLLSDYYRGVADANYLATLVPNLVGVAAATKGPIGEAFLARARDFATEPYRELASAGQEVLASLDGGQNASA